MNWSTLRGGFPVLGEDWVLPIPFQSLPVPSSGVWNYTVCHYGRVIMGTTGLYPSIVVRLMSGLLTRYPLSRIKFHVLQLWQGPSWIKTFCISRKIKLKKKKLNFWCLLFCLKDNIIHERNDVVLNKSDLTRKVTHHKKRKVKTFIFLV